jgi:hypothetical protein
MVIYAHFGLRNLLSVLCEFFIVELQPISVQVCIGLQSDKWTAVMRYFMCEVSPWFAVVLDLTTLH